MLDTEVQAAINDQIRHELQSAYLYLAMCAHFEAANYRGFAHWIRIQAKEELGHAMRLFDFANERGGRVELQALAAPASSFGEPIAIFEAALDHEKKVTALIHKLHETAGARKDYATQVFLQWFISEQVEEEKTASQIVETLKMIGDNRVALYMLDKELGRREDEG